MMKTFLAAAAGETRSGRSPTLDFRAGEAGRSRVAQTTDGGGPRHGGHVAPQRQAQDHQVIGRC